MSLKIHYYQYKQKLSTNPYYRYAVFTTKLKILQFFSKELCLNKTIPDASVYW